MTGMFARYCLLVLPAVVVVMSTAEFLLFADVDAPASARRELQAGAGPQCPAPFNTCTRCDTKEASAEAPWCDIDADCYCDEDWCAGGRTEGCAYKLPTATTCGKPMCANGTATFADAEAICSAQGATLCTAAEFVKINSHDDAKEGENSCAQTGTFWVKEATCAAGSEGTAEAGLAAVTDICRDWGNDCCANVNDGERAACADGYTPSRQPTSWDSCEYQCLRDSTCEALSTMHEVQCCKPNACIEDNGLDYDCCSRGTASAHEPKNSCAAGYTHTVANPPNQAGGRGECRAEWGTTRSVCTPDGEATAAFESFAGWHCPAHESWHEEDIQGEYNVLWSVLPGLIFGFGPLLISIPICMHCRSKSMNMAPFNGSPVQAFPRRPRAQLVQPAAQQVVEMKCPEGSGPGTQLQANANGQTFQVTVPQGVVPGATFQVQVPVTPAAPVMATTVNPAETAGYGGAVQAAGVSADSGHDTILPQMNGLEIRQQLNIAEAVTGCEAKNKYHVHSWNPMQPDVPGPFVMYIHEGEGDGCERVCCKQNRHLVLLIHEGTDQSADVIMQIHKSFGLAGLCCCRPSVQIFDGQANKIGHVDDPFHWCVMDQRIYGVDGRQIYGAAGSVCQMGIFCPCLGTVEFDIAGTNGQLTDGRISKIFGGCGEIMAGANNFRVRFPTGASPVEKMALIGALSFSSLPFPLSVFGSACGVLADRACGCGSGCTMLIDFEYFEKKQ